MLSHLKIAARLIVGFGALLLIIAAVNVNVLYQGYQTEENVGTALRSSGNKAKIYMALEDLYRTRMNVWAALATNNSDKWSNAEQTFKETEKDLEALLNTTFIPENRVKIEATHRALKEYKVVIDSLKKVGGSNANLDAPDVQLILRDAAQKAKEIDTTGEDLATVFSKISEDRSTDVQQRLEFLNKEAILIGSLSLLIGLFLWFTTSRSITVPIQALTRVMGELAAGNLSVAIPGIGNKDETGQMARAVQVFKDNAEMMDKMRKDHELAAAAAAEERRKALLKMADDFEGNVMGIVRIVSSSSTEMSATAQSMSAAAQQAAQQAHSVSASAENASDNVQAVAAATEELTASIGEIGQQVFKAAAVSKDAMQKTNETSALVQRLADAADKIGSVVDLITNIAGQTNLLALNATIEAARAGEAGKGFAVVAQEVKTLANQTAQATDEIGAQIGAVQGASKQALAAILEIDHIIHQVQEISTTISSAIEEQNAATKEIAQNVQRAAGGTSEVSNAIGGVTQAAQTTGTAAEEVLFASKDLSSNAEKLHTEVRSFLTTVRSEKKEKFQEWEAKLFVGLPSIDAEHKDLVDQINTAHDLFTAGETDEKLKQVITNLIAATLTHFDHEETLFNKTLYDENTHHKREHQVLRDKAREWQTALAQKGGKGLVLEDLVFLRNWLVDHIQGTDKRYVEHMKKHGVV